MPNNFDIFPFYILFILSKYVSCSISAQPAQDASQIINSGVGDLKNMKAIEDTLWDPLSINLE
jgi:hypothetical protein